MDHKYLLSKFYGKVLMVLVLFLNGCNCCGILVFQLSMANFKNMWPLLATHKIAFSYLMTLFQQLRLQCDCTSTLNLRHLLSFKRSQPFLTKITGYTGWVLCYCLHKGSMSNFHNNSIEAILTCTMHAVKSLHWEASLHPREWIH